MKFSIFLSLFLLLFTLFSCKEEKIVKPDDTKPTGYVQYGTPFDSMPSTESIVMYEVNLRAFSSAGTLQGVIERLDEIEDLGVNVIWLMPIHPIGEINSVNSPYSVRDYKAVNSEFGTLSDLRTLTTMAHTRKIAVIMDWVANHTSWDNAWINYPGWHSTDTAGNIIIPPGTNWQDVADLNFDNPDMRIAMIDAMKYWVLLANVDGFRCDYADGVPDDFWTQALDTLKSIPGRELLFLAEGSRAVHFTSGFDLMYAWNFYGVLRNVFTSSTAGNLFSTHSSEYAGVPEGKHRLRYSTNHDESAWNTTPMVLFNGKKGALAASVATIFIGGVPLFYTGQEVGRESTVPFFTKSPIDWDQNPDMLQEYKNIMSFYTQSDAARKGILKSYPANHIACFKKTFESEEILIIVNVRNNAIDYIIPTELQNSQWTNALTNTSLELGTTLHLENYNYLILNNQ
jgi:glycosidase